MLDRFPSWDDYDERLSSKIVHEFHIFAILSLNFLIEAKGNLAISWIFFIDWMHLLCVCIIDGKCENSMMLPTFN